MDSAGIAPAPETFVRSWAAPAVFVSTLLGLLYLAYQWALPRPLPGIPYGPEARRSIVGSLGDMLAYKKKHGRLRPWFIEQSVRFNSPLFQFWVGPLAKPSIILSDFQESQDILVRRAREFEHGDRHMSIFEACIPNHHIAMQTYNSRFKGNKELVRDLMSPAFLNEVSAPEIHAKTLNLIELWSLKAKISDGRPFAALLDIFDAALDMINAAAFAFDDSLGIIKAQLATLESHDKPEFKVAPNGSFEFPRDFQYGRMASFKASSEYIGNLFKSTWPTQSHRYQMLTNSRLRRQLRERDDLIKERIAKSLKGLESGDQIQRSAVDLILQRELAVAKKEGRAPDFYSRRIIDELFGYVNGGHETSSSSLSWLVKYIADEQRVQDKLRAALHTAYSDAIAEARQPNPDEIAKIKVPYLDAVIEESLRVRPPIPMVERKPINDTIVLGRRIPRGTQIYINFSGPGFLHPPVTFDASSRSNTLVKGQSTGTWNPEDLAFFRPERWLNENEQGEISYNAQAGPILTFSSGPRGCFGRRLAYLEIRTVLALLVWNFRFKKLKGELASYDPFDALTTSPKFCYIALEAVDSKVAH